MLIFFLAQVSQAAQTLVWHCYSTNYCFGMHRVSFSKHEPEFSVSEDLVKHYQY